jgi:hypothetical protein
MKLRFYFLPFIFIFCQFSGYNLKACNENNIHEILIQKTRPRGFDKKTLASLPPYEGKKTKFYYSNGINLKKSQIREFEYLPENKPSGFEVSENIYLRARVSVSYLRGMVEGINKNMGFYNDSVQSQLNERIGENEEDTAEGGIEISWYF